MTGPTAPREESKKASARSSKPSARSVLLRFDPDGAPSTTGESLQGELSVVLQVRDDLWLASDESASIERLSPGKGRVFEHHTGFLLADYLSLPAGDDAEVDIEGMAHERNYLWVVGSHSLSRRKADASSKHSKKQIRALAEVRTGGNRYLLARIPLMADSGGVSHQLFKTCPDPDDPTRTLSAAQLMGGDRGNLLTDALQDDENLAPFLGVPGKKNGFNIEGVGVVDGRLFIGMRGPVIGG